MILKALINERNLIEKHDENLVLQSQEFDSIACAMLEVAKGATVLSSEEQSAISWAKGRLGL